MTFKFSHNDLSGVSRILLKKNFEKFFKIQNGRHFSVKNDGKWGFEILLISFTNKCFMKFLDYSGNYWKWINLNKRKCTFYFGYCFVLCWSLGCYCLIESDISVCCIENVLFTGQHINRDSLDLKRKKLPFLEFVELFVVFFWKFRKLSNSPS